MKPRLLLVEDNELVARAFKMLIDSYGDVEIAASAAAASEALATQSWSAVILDIRLPDGSGLDVLEHARRAGCRSPALIYSGNHQPSELNRAFELGAEYLVKPATPNALLSFVTKALDRPSLRRWVDDWAARYELTPTETTILQAAAEGKTRTEIDATHDAAPATTKSHVHNLLTKTGDASLLAAVTRLLRERG